MTSCTCSLRKGKNLVGQTDLWTNPSSHLLTKEVVILNIWSLGFLICKIETILSSFSYSESEMKKTVCRGQPGI